MPHIASIQGWRRMAAGSVSYSYMSAWWRERTNFWFEPMSGEVEARARYARLAEVTERVLRRLGDVPAMYTLAYPASAGNVFGWRFQVAVAPCERLSQRWWLWDREARALMAKHPSVALREAIADASERYRSESWPCGYDKANDAWVASGDFDGAPKILQGFAASLSKPGFDGLVDLCRRAGGWWLWDEVLEREVWRPDPTGVA